MHILTSKANRSSDDVEGWGHRWDDENCYPYGGFIEAENRNMNSISGGSFGSKTVSFKPLSGLFQQNKHIPLMQGGLTLGFEIVGGATDPIVGIGGNLNTGNIM